jgi:hypothetical protein
LHTPLPLMFICCGYKRINLKFTSLHMPHYTEFEIISVCISLNISNIEKIFKIVMRYFTLKRREIYAKL